MYFYCNEEKKVVYLYHYSNLCAYKVMKGDIFMGKTLKRSLSVLLVVLILLTSAPLRGFVGLDFLGMFSVSAEEIEINTVNNDDKLYYSELFYGYPYYIANDTYFDSYVNTVNGIYDSIYSSYINSEQVVGTGLEHALDTITSPTDIITLITDRLGLTSFSYNDALDAANEEFVKHILSDSLAYSIEDSYGKSATLASELNTLIKYFNVFSDESSSGIKYTTEYYLQEAFDFLHDKGCFSYVSTNTLANLWAEINDSKFSLNDCFDIAKDEIEFAEAIMIALVMEDNRLEIVNDILSTQNSDTVLKQGMARLKTKMQNNFVECIIKDYLVKKVADKLFDAIDDIAVDAIGGGELKIILGIVKAAFNLVVDVAKFDDVLKWQVLICYSKDLASGILSLAKSFDDGPFLSDLILKYERLFIGYDAVNKAAMESTTAISNMEDPFGAAYGVLSEAVANNISDITITSGLIKFNIPSSVTEQELYDILTAGTFMTSAGSTIKFGKEIKISNGLTTINVPIKANVWSSIMRGCISENSQLIYAFKNGYGSTSLYGEHINNIKNAILNTPISERQTISKANYSNWSYTVYSSTKLREDTNVVEPGCMYGLNDTILIGKLTVGRDNTLSIPKNVDIAIDGNVYMYYIGYFGSSLVNNGRLTINGTLTFNSECSLTNNNELIVTNLDCGSANSRSSVTNNGIIRTVNCNVSGHAVFSLSKDSSLYVSGNYQGDQTMAGTIVFDGNSVQSVSGLRSSYAIDVQNKCGISYSSDVSISGWYKLNGNPIYTNGYWTRTYGNARFDDSDYGTIYAGNLTLTDSIKADIIIYDGMSDGYLTIPKEADVVIEGSISTRKIGYYTSVLVNKGNLKVCGDITINDGSSIENEGILTVTGSLTTVGGWDAVGNTAKNNGTIKTHNANFNGRGVVFTAGTNSKIYISGNYDGKNYSVGTAIFNGTSQQTVYNLSAETIILENSSSNGVRFATAISPTTLFNHNRNVFSCASGSTFVDYDTDGKKDNVDPYPLDPTDGENDSDFELKMIDSKIYVVGYNGHDKDIVIPTAVGSYTISGINDLNGDFIESVTIPETVTKISSSAFDDLISLKNIYVDLNNNIYASKDGILYSCDISELVRCPIGYEKSKFQLPEAIKRIGASAFKNCSLQEINLPNTLTEIGSYAFQYTKLTEITIPESVVSIEKSAFANCLSLKSVQYNAANCSASYTAILGIVLMDTVFSGSSVNEITIGDNVKNIPNGIFAKSYIKSIVVPPNVEKIGAYAFADCTSLTNIYGYEGVVSIDKYAFSGCSSLGTTKIGYTVTTIGSNAFNNCTSLTIQCYNNTSALNYATSNSIPYEIIEVPLETIELNNQSVLKGSINALNYSIVPFYTSENIVFTSSNETVGYFDSNNRFVADKCGQTVVTIASESDISVSCVVTVVGVEGAETTDFDYEIQDASVVITGYTGSETEIVIPDTIAGIPVTHIDSDFNGSVFESITIGSNVTGISSKSFNKANNLKNIYVNVNNISLISIDGVLYSFDGEIVLKYPRGKIGESYSLPDAVRVIGAEAFYGASLTEIDISNITTINEASFSNSKLTQAIIPASVTSIPDNSFNNCTSLEIIDIPYTVTSIGENAFSGCSNLIVCCYQNSVAYDYAVNNSIAYNLIELDTDNIIVTGIQETIIDGRQYQLSAEIAPVYTDENIVWSSSDSNIFTVSNTGLITAKGAGEAILTVASSRGYVSKAFNINVLGLVKDSENANLYHVRNADDMLTLSTMVNSGVSFAGKTIQLDSDIDLSNIAWTPIGIDSTNVFSGVFDGNNHKISGLNYVTTSNTYSGFFGYIKTGGIKDLTVEGSVSGISRVGMIAGCIFDSALYNCKVIGEVKRIGSGSYGYVGGLVGSALHSVIINCAAETDITTDFGDSSINYAAVGGIVGAASTAGSDPMCILNSYCIGDISVSGNSYAYENYYVGGIAGYLKDDAANNYYFGEITNADGDTIKRIGYAFGYVVPEYTSESDYNGIGTIIVQDNYYLEGKNAIGLISEGDYDSSNWVSPISEENFSKLIGEGSLVDELNGNKGSVEDIIVAHRDILSNSTWAELVDRINGDSFTVSSWKIGANNLPVNYECDCYRHAESEWVIDVEATCTKEGSKHTYCLVCQETVTTSIIEKVEHKFSDWTEIKAATCTEKGSEYRSCTACNSETETRDIDKLGHSFDGEWTTDKAPTCTKSGIESRVCTRCESERETRTVDKLGHDFESKWTVDKEATCSKAGSKSHHCSRCDEKSDVTAISKIAHSYKESVQEATCTKDGKKTYNCSACGDSYSEVITAKRHIDQNGDGKCDNCEYIYDNTCDHMCHKSGFNGFIWKIVRFFWKLFKMNPVCKCGVSHY